MTPYLQLKEEQQHLQLFLSLPQRAASSPSADHLTFFNNTTTQEQRVRAAVNKPEESKPFDQKVKKYMTHRSGSTDQQASSSSPLQSAAVDIHSAANGHNLPFSGKEYGDYESAINNNGSSVKWMSSKMRLMKKMTNSHFYNPPPSSADNKPVNKFQYQVHDTHETNCFSKSNINAIRVCSDCNTTTTPLWRSGPRGPKSLCNACGIRQRKARRALEAAANGAAIATDATSMKIKAHNNKEKKSRTIHVAQYKKQLKSTPDNDSPPYHHHHHHHHRQSQKKLCFKQFAISLSKNSALQRVFTQDVEDAAILLMQLSCGLVHN